MQVIINNLVKLNIYLFICLFIGCNSVKKSKTSKVINNLQLNIDDKIKKREVVDTNTIDTLLIGTKFYKYNAFIGYNFVETEPYEFIELNNQNNSTQIMIYSKYDNYYILLVSAEDIVDKYDYNWEILRKTIVDIKSFNTEFEICWYLYDNNIPPEGRFGVGKSTHQIKVINEYFECEAYKKYKIFDVDYKRGKIIELDKKETIFYCSDGY